MTQVERNRASVRRYRERNRELINQRRREYHVRNKDKESAYTKRYRANPAKKEILERVEARRRMKPGYVEKHREEARIYAAKNREACNARSRIWYQQNKELAKEVAKRNHRIKMADPVYREAKYRKQRLLNYEVKAIVFKHYGGVCACCGESIMEFLCIDHMNGNGNQHRREIKLYGGTAFYHWLKRNGLPSGYQVLCHNCNMAKSCFGGCPHRKGMA